MAARPLIALMLCAVASAQSPDDYNVFVRALPPQQTAQQVYAPPPQQPYQQVRGPPQFQYQDTYPSQYYQDYHQPAPAVQQQRHLPQHPAPSSASSSQEEVDDFTYQQAYEPPTTSTTTSTTTTTTTTTTTEPPPPPVTPSTEAPRAPEVQKSQMSVSSSVENSDRQGKAQQTAGGQKPVQVVQKTVTKDKDGKKEEYVVYYYYYYDDDKKNETAKEQPVDSLDSFDSDSKSKFQPRAPSSTTASPSTAAVPKEAISTASPTRSQPASSMSTSVSSGAPGADQIAALTGARLIPETGSQPQSPSPASTTSTSTTTTSTTTSTTTTEAPSTSTAASDDRRKGFGNRRNKPQRQSGETNRRRTSTTSTTTEAPSRKPLASRKPRPTRPSRLNRKPRPTTEAPKENEETKDEQKETVTSAPEGDKPGRKRFGGGPRPRGPKRTTAAPAESDDSGAVTTAAPKKPLPTRGTAGGLFGKGQGIRGPRPKPGRRPIKKEEPTASEAPVEDKDKPTEATKPDEAAAKPEIKAEETPAEGSSDATTAAPARARQRQRGALFAGGRPRPNLKRPSTAAAAPETEN